ncbi:hypothetical protein M433DRAFT_137602 [Acidomyces richmondensis BFW]|nr:hypothetical protein M433DRAFT_137602 [Acidomyces richmondensis BFW]
MKRKGVKINVLKPDTSKNIYELIPAIGYNGRVPIGVLERDLEELPELRGKYRLPSDTPIHPHIDSFRASRSLSPQDDSNDTVIVQYQSNLHELLNSERWKHGRTIHNLHNETRRREQVEKELEEAKRQCRTLSKSLKSCVDDLNCYETGRFGLCQEIKNLREEIESLRAANQSLHLEVPRSTLRRFT